MIYFIQHGEDGPIKIGYTSGNIQHRLAALQVSTPIALTLIGTMDGSMSDEMRIQNELKEYRVRGEWFSPSKRVLSIAKCNAKKTDRTKVLSKLSVDQGGLLTIDQVAYILNYSRAWIAREIESGNIEAQRAGIFWIIPASAVEGYARRPRGRQKAKPPATPRPRKAQGE